MPFFTVVIPVHNSTHTLRRCVDSVRAQGPETEILLIENTSVDDSWQLCCQYAERDPMARAFQCAHGPSQARNLGIDRASGEYILFLDSDDAIELGRLAPLEQLLRTQNWPLCLLRHVVALPDGEIQPPFFTADRGAVEGKTGKNAFAYLYGPLHMATAPWLYAYRTDYLRTQGVRFPENTSLGEDLCFVTQALWNAPQVGMFEPPLYRYTQAQAGSLSTGCTEKSVQNLRTALDLGQKAAQLLPNAEQRRCFLTPYCNSALWMLTEYGKMPPETQHAAAGDMQKMLRLMGQNPALRFRLPYLAARLLGCRNAARLLRLGLKQE